MGDPPGGILRAPGARKDVAIRRPQSRPCHWHARSLRPCLARFANPRGAAIPPGGWVTLPAGSSGPLAPAKTSPFVALSRARATGTRAPCVLAWLALRTPEARQSHQEDG